MSYRYLFFLLVFPLFAAVAGLLLPARPVFAQIQPPQPLLCYDFDDTTDYFGSNDLSLVGSGVSVGNTPGGAVGDYIRFNNGLYPSAEFASPTTSNSDVTVIFWSKDVGDGSGETYIGSSAADGWQVTQRYGGTVTVYADHGASGTNLGDGSWFSDFNQWQFHAVVFSSGGITFTTDDGSNIDPVLESFTTTGAQADGSTATFHIQSDYVNYDQVMVWNEALSSDEIEWVWNTRTGRLCSEMAVAPTPTPTATTAPTSTPTATPTPTPAPSAILLPTAQYTLTLENGGQVDLYLQVTAGEAINGFFSFMTFITLITLAIRQLAHRSASNES